MNKKAIIWIFIGIFAVTLAEHYQNERDVVKPSFQANLDLIYLTVSSLKQQIKKH